MNIKNNILEFIPFPVWVKDNNGEIVYLNNCFINRFNISIDDFFNKNINPEKEKTTNYIKGIDDKIITLKNINNILYKHVVFYDESNNKSLIGFLIDIQNENNEELANQRNILRTIIDNIPELVFYKDNNNVYRGVNKQCTDFYKNLGVDNVIGKKDIELPLKEEFIATCIEHDKIVLDTKKQLIIDEEVPTPEGKTNIMETTKTPVINDNGDVWGIVGIVRDVTESKNLENKLRHLSYTDRLTGLYNRAYFDEKIKDLIKNKKFPMGIIVGDVNGLKIINDTIGHLEGDKLLKAISNKLRTVFDDLGFIFRWGGDEFVVLLPNTSDKDCEYLMQKLNDLCSNYDDKNFKLSISLGYSILNDKKEKIDDVLSDAEDKLYRQKILNEKSVRSSILHTLKESLQSKNVETEEHTKRVAKNCVLVGKMLGLDTATLDELSLLGSLHDIGKIGIPERLLLKKSKLTDEEYEIIKTHSEKGYRLAMLLPELNHIARGILTHHERWDGSGYPLGLAKENIPLVSRIVSVCDAYDSMTNNSIYSDKKTSDEAIKELKKCSGNQFDPKVVKVLCEIIEDKNKP